VVIAEFALVPLPPLGNLVRISQLKAEPSAQAELDSLIRSGRVRLTAQSICPHPT